MCASSITPIPPGGGQQMVPGQVVQIQTLPDALQNVQRTLHLEAEVVRQNSDGSTRVRTAEGEMDIVVKGRQPQPGQRMEIEIPPGRPPQKAITRPAPQAPAQASPPPVQDGDVPQMPPPLPQTPVTQKPPVQGGQQPPVQSPPVTTLPAPKPDTGNAQRPTIPQTGATIEQAIASKQDSALFTQQTYNAGGKQAATPTTPQTQTATAPNIIGNTQQPITGTPLFKASDILQLAAGQTVKLVPIPAPAVEGMAKPVIADGMITTPDGVQKPQGTNLVTSLLQAVKTALPQPVTNAITNIITKPALMPDGTPVIAKPSNGIATPVTPGTNIALPDGMTVAMPALEAKIIQVKSPSGQIQILTLQTDASETAQVATAPKPSPITVNVSMVTSQKLPVVGLPVNAMPNAPMQNFVIPLQSPMIDTGAQITLMPQAPQNIPPAQVAALPPAWRALLPLMQPSALWPVMDDMFQSFAGTTPQAAQILGRIIPSPANGANMGPAMMLFAAAIKSGDIQGWIGDKKLGMLQKLGKADLVSRLAGETSALTQNTDAPATEWKSLPIPMLWQNEISKVMFHVRQEPRDENDPDGETGTHFVFDLDLTRMGEVQLDGLVRGNRLDLIVRTKESISTSMQEAMKKAYADALVGTDIFGELGFQGDIKAWMRVASEKQVLKIDL